MLKKILRELSTNRPAFCFILVIFSVFSWLDFIQEIVKDDPSVDLVILNWFSGFFLIWIAFEIADKHWVEKK